jgi:glycosyltransferase involved in cell wall biosynthesis
MNWTLWQNILSPHLSAVARALASIPGQNVTVVAENELPDRRRATGWRTPDCAPARSYVRPTDTDVERLIEGNETELSVHLLNGLAGVPLNRRVLPRLVKTGAMVGLISESADNRGILGLARKAKYRLDRYRVGQNFDFILAMGQLGVQWFESAGYDSSKVFPFAYVTERPVRISDHSHGEKEHTAFRILYMGQIIRRKDGVTAIRGLRKLSVRDWRFDIVGNGPDLRRWRQVASEGGVADRIHFRPAVDNGVIGSLLQHAEQKGRLGSRSKRGFNEWCSSYLQRQLWRRRLAA